MNVVVLLSGGIDSTVALAHSIAKGHRCHAITFNYGQTHQKEIESATTIATHYKIPQTTIDLTHLFKPKSAITGHAPIPDTHANQLDATYVPARNLLMLAVAAAHAENTGGTAVVIGANAADQNAYPDCRPAFLAAMDEATRFGTLNHVGVWMPLISMNKKQLITYGSRLQAPLHLTWSCYRSGDNQCGHCGACEANQ